MPEQNGTTNGQTFVTAFARGLSVIQAFGPESPRMTLAEVATRTGLDRAVARRLLLTLVDLGLAAVVNERKFELTPRILSLGFSYFSSIGFDRSLQPYLDQLSRLVGETISVSVLDGEDVLFLARSDAAGRRMVYLAKLEDRIPAYLSSSGRLLLSDLSDAELSAYLHRIERRAYTANTITDPDQLMAVIREAGRNNYAVIDQELEDGILGASVILRDRRGNAVAALNMSSHVGRLDKARLVREFIPILQDWAPRFVDLLL
ncbi:IclR family transcriptional regulator C-terminal domain-containing protein [Rhodomicrobium sp.]|uniref:IclR family transcriptional regulator domain-containing protein n=1 Tax=Rhodomicrobium sp. TaxID=2720632 RepID=UPI0039E65E85